MNKIWYICQDFYSNFELFLFINLNKKDDDCKVLWCKADSRDSRDPNESANQCVTTYTKWADGTPCGLTEPTVNDLI